MKRLFFILICYFFLAIGCDKKEDIEEVKVQLIFEETQCANPWEALPESDNYLDEVKSYLETEKITVLVINVTRIYDGPLYGGCSILSGRRIEITIIESDTEKAQLVGFKLIDD